VEPGEDFIGLRCRNILTLHANAHLYDMLEFYVRRPIRKIPRSHATRSKKKICSMSSSALRKFLLRIHVKVTCQSHLSCRTLIWAVVTYNRSPVVGAALKLMRMHGTAMDRVWWPSRPVIYWRRRRRRKSGSRESWRERVFSTRRHLRAVAVSGQAPPENYRRAHRK